MRIKSYFAQSVDHAMTQAREELGVEAMLLNTRRVAADRPEHEGYEVVFGIADESPEVIPEVVAEPAAIPVAVAAPAVEKSAPASVESDLNLLHAQMDELRSLLLRSTPKGKSMARSIPELAAAYEFMVAAGIEAALSADIVDRLESFLAANGPKSHGVSPSLEDLLRQELESRVGLAPRLGTDVPSGVASSAVVVLVGPRGAGKTTTLAKLAVSRTRYANARPARLLSLDTSRADAHAQLQSVARTFGIAFQDVPAAYLLPGLIAERRQNEILFVDTPGYTAMDAKTAEATAAVFRDCPQLDVHLVVPGYMKARDLRVCIQKYAPFRPTKLLVTKLDETDSLGSSYSEAVRAGLRLSFMAYGTTITGDLRPVASDDLLRMAIDSPRVRAQSVA